ncbi:FKBP-type peptidyl-prolyl cis-trans isomerase [Nocardioides sp.]|uniref:FKBP-type peptidyl-prolyl cis-trans isomerase n=1 Tax=Nocardioides sp. TaxID=35761 RepID=UPI001A2EA2B4|nr:FKBP-type peptidyl-prolyl cis-trans isomerase [Nocardioides sp.]MBJ7359538.1 FKBP-type peptidyl-prolyl cis-trans isomerase [Nocardioides sp.]
MSALRRLPLLLVPALLSVSLAACGEDPVPAEPTKERLDAVEITGEVGAEPEVAWSSQMTAGDIESETLVEGDGAALEDGDQVLAHLWIGNGFTQAKAFSTHDEDATAELVTLDDQLPPFLAGIKGATIGSRIAVTSSAEAAFGAAGNAQLGIGNKDSVLVIIDLASGIDDGPTGTRPPAPDWVPPLEFKKGVISGFDFEGVPEPTDQLQKAVLFEGDGPVVETGNAIVVRYLGQVYGGKKPFDENFSADAPTSFAIGTEAVIKGWDQTLVGATVGTRMVIAVPPELGYGEEGNPDAGIKRTDTLYFVIDVLATA